MILRTDKQGWHITFGDTTILLQEGRLQGFDVLHICCDNHTIDVCEQGKVTEIDNTKHIVLKRRKEGVKYDHWKEDE